MNNRILIGLVVIIIIIVGAIYWNKNSNTVSTPVLENNAPISTTTEDTSTVGTVSAVKEFTLTAGNFKFSLNEIKVKKGDTVKITLINDEGFHD